MFNIRILIAATLVQAGTLNAQDGPTHVLLTYRIYPDRRVAFRNNLTEQRNRFTRWRDEGFLASCGARRGVPDRSGGLPARQRGWSVGLPQIRSEGR